MLHIGAQRESDLSCILRLSMLAEEKQSAASSGQASSKMFMYASVCWWHAPGMHSPRRPSAAHQCHHATAGLHLLLGLSWGTGCAPQWTVPQSLPQRTHCYVTGTNIWWTPIRKRTPLCLPMHLHHSPMIKHQHDSSSQQDLLIQSHLELAPLL